MEPRKFSTIARLSVGEINTNNGARNSFARLVKATYSEGAGGWGEWIFEPAPDGAVRPAKVDFFYAAVPAEFVGIPLNRWGTEPQIASLDISLAMTPEIRALKDECEARKHAVLAALNEKALRQM